MKQKLETLLSEAIESLKKKAILDKDASVQILIERTKDKNNGDFATNLAMVLAKAAKTNPRLLAETIIDNLQNDPAISKIEIAGPGFINFFLDESTQFQVLQQIHSQQADFGLSQSGAGKKIQLEFVSANPTGPLHVGHGRGAAYGSAVASLLSAVGYDVHTEYYVNDAGRQMDILATSVWLRYLELCEESILFPSNGYRGDYVKDIAKILFDVEGKRYHKPAKQVFHDIPADEPDGGDKEEHIDALINQCKSLLSDHYEIVFQQGLNVILADIKEDLEEFGVSFQEWFSERKLMQEGAVSAALERLQESGYLYVKDGATWFSSSQLGDEKDRVVIRENGQTTYFASDIAYHMNKLDRGFEQIINIWGSDHHGYIPRLKAAMTALGADEKRLKVLLVQFAILYRGKDKVPMSTRAGEFVTLRELREEVGKDAARFFYVMRKSEQHMDFDLELATSKTNENPVYYVQYAHARICSVFRQLNDKGLNWNQNQGMKHLNLLTETHEKNILDSLAKFPEVIEKSAAYHEPHQLIQFLRELANQFHAYYNAHQFLVDNQDLCNARLNLISAIRQVLSNGLVLLNISTPETM